MIVNLGVVGFFSKISADDVLFIVRDKRNWMPTPGERINIWRYMDSYEDIGARRYWYIYILRNIDFMEVWTYGSIYVSIF